MNGTARKLLVLAALFGLSACGSTDKVLEKDDEGDASTPADGGDSGGSTGSNTGNGGTTGGNASGGSTGGGTTGGTTGGVAQDPDCDMNGIWIGRQLTRSQAIGSGQFSNNWYYLEFAQNGQDVTVTKHFDCGIEVHGSVTVKQSKATVEALLKHNVMTGRKGKLSKDGTSCRFEMERFWSVRGADEKLFAPTPRNSPSSIKDLAQKNPIPKSPGQMGIEDTEKDGKDGVAWQVTGIVSGTRNTTQRDYSEWFSDAKHPFPASMNWTDDIVVRARFDNEENIIDPTSGLLAQLATADTTAEHLLTLRFLGRAASDPRVTAIVKANDYDTCLAIQKAIPFADGF